MILQNHIVLSGQALGSQLRHPGGQSPRGRWRTEETIRYLIDDSEVVIQQIWSDGSVSEDRYGR